MLSVGIANVIKKTLSELGNENNFQIFYNNGTQPSQLCQPAAMAGGGGRGDEGMVSCAQLNPVHAQMEL